ncbi:MAG TPA: hypothetical protein VKU60_05340 [Chloroflexota bacterium]|nr:hypothetical protein [Chloroflexota bacterium]
MLLSPASKLEWLDAHAGSVQAFATLVLVIITAYYAWTSRAQVRATQATLQATARMTLQGRLDRVSELLLDHPELFRRLDDPEATGAEKDERFHLANILVGVLEEAYVQHHVEGSMPAEEWRAWEATLDGLMGRRYLAGYWRLSRGSFGESFTRYLDERIGVSSDSG